MAIRFVGGGLDWSIAVGRPDPDLAVTWTILVAGTIVTLALGLLIFTAARRERYAPWSWSPSG